jgi:hypothetical protein
MIHHPSVYSIADAARRLGISYWKLYGLHREGVLNLLIGENNRPYLTDEDLEEARRVLALRRRLKQMSSRSPSPRS